MKSMLYDLNRYKCIDKEQISITLPAAIKLGAEIISNEQRFLGQSILVHTYFQTFWEFNNTPISKELTYQCELVDADDQKRYKIVGFSSPFVTQITTPQQVASYLAEPIMTKSDDAVPSLAEIKSILESSNDSVSTKIVGDKLSITIGSDAVEIMHPEDEFKVGSNGLLNEQTLND